MEDTVLKYGLVLLGSGIRVDVLQDGFRTAIPFDALFGGEGDKV